MLSSSSDLTLIFFRQLSPHLRFEEFAVAWLCRL